MIGNRYLQDLCDYPDEDTSINQLLEILQSKDQKFIDSLNEEIDIELCNKKEFNYLIKIAAIIDYSLQLLNMEVPSWLRNEKLSFPKPYYYSKRLSDFDKIRLQYTCPSPFKIRNMYFDIEDIKRV